MLNMVSRKSLLLFGVVLALCAFVLPSVASAAGFEPAGAGALGTGTIDSGTLGFSIPGLNSGSACTSSQFHVQVHSTTVATITAGRFANCHGSVGGAVGCTTTATGVGFPWVATAESTSNIVIHNANVHVVFETTPGTLNECGNNGLNLRWTGNVTISYTPVGKVFDFNGGTGLSMHIPGLGTIPTTPRGFAAATGLLNILM